MRLELFDYPLPPERIAQTPLEPRDASRLLHVRPDGRREHLRFLDLPQLLNPGDLLVFNDTRVLPARLHGEKETGARVEILLLQRLDAGKWEGLAYPGRRLQPGARIRFGGGELTAEVLDRGAEGTRILQFHAEGGPHAADELIHRIGEMPLPPYIHERLEDQERYQTLYAREEGSAAAPTAGLHFTPRVFQALRERGIGLAYVTLHVGIATFRPVKTETIESHEMHEEWYSVPEEAARAIRECTGRVVAVGTTTLRCLESAAVSGGSEFGVHAPRTGGEGSGEPPWLPEDRGEHAGTKSGASGDPSPGPSPTGRGEDEDSMPGATAAASGTSHSPRFSGGRGGIRAGSGRTRLYITPGYQFRVVDALLTNFHMPRSSLLILVSAFAGYEAIRAAYEDALKSGYRFLSFGDAMFLERTGDVETQITQRGQMAHRRRDLDTELHGGHGEG